MQLKKAGERVEDISPSGKTLGDRGGTRLTEFHLPLLLAIVAARYIYVWRYARRDATHA